MGPEPDSYKSLFLSNAEYNYARYKNADFDKLWEEAAVETDKTKRAELYHKIQETARRFTLSTNCVSESSYCSR